ncbi:hypothetical protein AAHU67_06720 [Klebsiella pneumoniae]|uniref:hypothetical protein n=1 Tax=Klebsiella pneumoniae TaxID=573 RepID=UPI001033BB5D|nr:hypothetical protein [Klebsiella pneumoniae]HBR4404512.1 hypothetical protein [Klebsiella pneumoniae]HDS2650535.1 hypothetical protein [Klebsiella pneumoniae subsp. pneumoniae]
MKNEVEQIAQQNDMSIEFVTWFFNEKKANCGNVWFMMMAAMWEGWKGRSIEMDKLAAENVELKSSRSVLAENTLESCNSIACAGFRHEAIMRGLYASTGNGNKYPKPITTLVDEAMRKLETPATDRIVAGIKADGVALVKSAFEMHIQSASCYQDEIVGVESALSIACQVESQLREGADK